MINKPVAWGIRWVIWLLFHVSMHVQLFEWLCIKFEVNTFCGISVSGHSNCKSALSEKMVDRPSCTHPLPRPTTFLDLSPKQVHKDFHQIWHPKTAASSPRWRRGSVITILTMKMMLSFLWTTFWKFRMLTYTKKGGVCSSTAGLVLGFLKLTSFTFQLISDRVFSPHRLYREANIEVLN